MRWADAEERHEQYAIDRACHQSHDDRQEARPRKRSLLLELWEAVRMPGYRPRYTRRDDSQA